MFGTLQNLNHVHFETFFTFKLIKLFANDSKYKAIHFHFYVNLLHFYFINTVQWVNVRVQNVGVVCFWMACSWNVFLLRQCFIALLIYVMFVVDILLLKISWTYLKLNTPLLLKSVVFGEIVFDIVVTKSSFSVLDFSTRWKKIVSNIEISLKYFTKVF